MPTSSIESIRRFAAVGIAGAALSAISGAVVQGAVQPSTTVPDTMWRYPWSSGAFVLVSVVYAAMHILVIVGLIGLRRSGMAGPTRAASAGLVVAVTGTALLFVGELASIPIRHDRTDDTAAAIVGAVFGIAVVLSAVGFLITGRATIQAGLWNDWRRFTPLATGLWTTALVGISLTKALPTGVGIYGLCLLALFVALYTRPVPSALPAPAPTEAQVA
jgi:hypothetical protein